MRRRNGIVGQAGKSFWPWRFCSALVFGVVAILGALPVFADIVAPGIGFHCRPAIDSFAVYPAYFEYRGDGQMPPEEDYALNAGPVGEDVVSCQLGKVRLTLTRDFLHLPRPSGICGGAQWATWTLNADGQTAAIFHIGCGDVLLNAGSQVLTLCAEKSECRLERWDRLVENPFRVNLLGKWQP